MNVFSDPTVVFGPLAAAPANNTCDKGSGEWNSCDSGSGVSHTCNTGSDDHIGRNF